MDTFFSDEKKKYLNKVITFVCKESQLKKVALYSSDKSREISKPRFILWYILHTEYKFSMPEIAQEFNRSPSTVHHGIRYVKTAGISVVIKDRFEKFKKLNDSNSNQSKKRNS